MLLEIINRIFANRKSEVFETLKKYGLEKFMASFYAKILALKKDDLNSERKTLSSLSSSLLTRINSVLETVESLDEKKELEYIISEIATEFIFQIIQIDGISKREVLSEIKDSLTITCEINNWDQKALFRIIKIDLMHSLTVKASNTLTISNKQNFKDKTCYYTWLERKGKSYSLDDFSYDIKGIKGDKLIKSVTAFKKLFSDHDGNIRVKMNGEQLEFIIILFDQLNEFDFISINGKKGHFHPLKKYCIDFEEKELIKVEPKRIKERIQRNKVKYQILLDKANKLLELEKQEISDLDATFVAKSQFQKNA